MKLSLGLTPRDYTVSGGAVTYDTDAQAYFTANTAITSDADKAAINDFYLGLKTDGIYTKIKAMYLPIWGASSSDKWNLVNALDTDAAYRLVFSTGWTHSSSGITPTNAFSDTFLSPTVMDQNSIHGSAYLRNNVAVTAPAFSSEGTSYANGFYVWPRQSTNQYSVRINDNSSANGASSNSSGLNIITRTASNSKRYRRNNTQVMALTTASTGRNNQSIYIAKSRNVADYYSNQYSFMSFGDGLSDLECNNLYTRVQTLMTYFGINV